MTEIYLHFLFAHYGLYGNAPVVMVVVMPHDTQTKLDISEPKAGVHGKV